MTKLNLNKNNTVFVTIRYYSFYLGELGTKKHTWIHEDLKIPATDVKQAIIFHFNIFSPKKKLDTPTLFMVGRYRLVIEYELVRSVGVTVMQYKKIKVHTGFSICRLF